MRNNRPRKPRKKDVYKNLNCDRFKNIIVTNYRFELHFISIKTDEEDSISHTAKNVRALVGLIGQIAVVNIIYVKKKTLIFFLLK